MANQFAMIAALVAGLAWFASVASGSPAQAALQDAPKLTKTSGPDAIIKVMAIKDPKIIPTYYESIQSGCEYRDIRNLNAWITVRLKLVHLMSECLENFHQVLPRLVEKMNEETGRSKRLMPHDPEGAKSATANALKFIRMIERIEYATDGKFSVTYADSSAKKLLTTRDPDYLIKAMESTDLIEILTNFWAVRSHCEKRPDGLAHFSYSYLNRAQALLVRVMEACLGSFPEVIRVLKERLKGDEEALLKFSGIEKIDSKNPNLKYMDRIHEVGLHVEKYFSGRNSLKRWRKKKSMLSRCKRVAPILALINRIEQDSDAHIGLRKGTFGHWDEIMCACDRFLKSNKQ